MLLELFPFVILNNAMAFVYAYFFSDCLCFDLSLLLLTVTLRGVSNKHCCLLSFFFSFYGKVKFRNLDFSIGNQRITLLISGPRISTQHTNPK